MKDPLRWLADCQAPAALREVLSSASPPPDMPAELRNRLGRFTERLVAGSLAAGGAAAAAGAVRSAAAAVGDGGTATVALAASAGSAVGGGPSGLAPALGGNAVGLAAGKAAGVGAVGAPGTGLGALLSWGVSGVAAKTVVGVAVAGAVTVTVTAAYLGTGGTSTHGARNVHPPGSGSAVTQPIAAQSGRPASVQATNRATGLMDGTRALPTAPQHAPPSGVARAAIADSRRVSATRDSAFVSPSASPLPDSGAVQGSPKPPSEAAYGEPTLLDEARTLEQARAAVQTNPAKALELVTDHQRYYPAGQLTAERELIAIEALLRLGRREEAMRRAAPSLARAPGSLYAKRLRRLLGSD